MICIATHPVSRRNPCFCEECFEILSEISTVALGQECARLSCFGFARQERQT